MTSVSIPVWLATGLELRGRTQQWGFHSLDFGDVVIQVVPVFHGQKRDPAIEKKAAALADVLALLGQPPEVVTEPKKVETPRETWRDRVGRNR